jgi:hypothetical protein
MYAGLFLSVSCLVLEGVKQLVLALTVLGTSEAGASQHIEYASRRMSALEDRVG